MSTSQKSFGFPKLSQKFAAKYGDGTKQVRIEMKYSDQIKEFVFKLKEANRKAADSSLNFR